MAPVAAVAELRRKVGQFFVVPDFDVLEPLDQAQVARVDVIAGALDGDGEVAALGLVRRPAHLHVAIEHHARRAPVVDRVREHVDVHEEAVGLAGQELAPLAIEVSQAHGRLARIPAGAEQVDVVEPVGIVPFTPKRLCLTLMLAWPSSPQAPSKQILEGRNASSQSGSRRPPMSWM